MISVTPSRPPTPDDPIGVFDSGVGGLSVVRALVAQLPQENLLYVADAAHCPYGARAPEEIRHLSEGISRYLIAQGAKVVVVACNTASAAALRHLRETFPQTPFVGMVPAVKPAAQLTQSGVVGVLATPITIGGALYEEVVEQYGVGVRVISRACPGLVERVEEGDLDGPATLELVRDCVTPLLRAGADTLVLGCTHYPFLIPLLRRLVGDGVHILEPSDAVARQTGRVLGRLGLLRRGGEAPRALYTTSGEPRRLAVAVERLLGQKADVRQLLWRGDSLGER
jgi:glutamate racemase